MSNYTIPQTKLSSGYCIPQIGYGTWLSKPGEVAEGVRLAIAAGYRHIDCAFIYGNQKEIGSTLSDLMRTATIRREELFITSKIWNTFHSYADTLKNVDMILAELQVDYLDLCLIHWPLGYQSGSDLFPKTPDGKIKYSDDDYLDTWRALEDSVAAGKVRTIGLSNFNSEQIDRIWKVAKIKPAVLQIEIHPYLNQKKLIDWCSARDIQITAYSPLANLGSIFRKPDDPDVMADPTIRAIAADHQKTPAQILLRWAVQRGEIVIPKSLNKVRVEENVRIFDFELSCTEMERVDSLDRGWRLSNLARDVTHPHFPFHAQF